MRTTDLDALRRVAAGADALTFDHEHVPTEMLEKLVAEGVKVLPPPEALVHAQDKLVMRRRLEALGAPVPRFSEVVDIADVDAFAARIGGPVVVKTVRGGYDGRGVTLARDLAEARDAVGALSGRRCRGAGRGEGRRCAASWPRWWRARRSARGRRGRSLQTVQRDGICVEVLAPAPRLDDELAREAAHLALRLADDLGVVGVLAVELFETLDGTLSVNELAMRPHNSGHWTMDGARTSQFEQHLRAVLDYPLGDTSPIAPVTVMANVLGAQQCPEHGHGRATAPPVRPDAGGQGASVRQGRTSRPQDRPRQRPGRARRLAR